MAKLATTSIRDKFLTVCGGKWLFSTHFIATSKISKFISFTPTILTTTISFGSLEIYKLTNSYCKQEDYLYN